MFRRIAWAALATASLVMVFACDTFGPDSNGEGARLAWTRPLGRVPQGGWQGVPAIAGDLALGMVGGAVQAFDLTSGELQWRSPLLNDGTFNAAESIVVSDGRMFVAEAWRVVASDLDSGAELWRFVPEASAARCEITVDDEAVYIGTRSHRVYALDVATGQPHWSVDVGPSWEYLGIVRGISRAQDTLYVAAEQFTNEFGGTRTAHVIALDARTGAELWRYRAAGEHNSVNSAVRVIGKYLLGSDFYGSSFFALDRFSGQEVWRVFTAPQSFGPHHTPTETGGMVFAGAQGGVYAAELDTGRLIWKREDLVGATSTALCGRVLLVQNQTIQVLDPRTGASLNAFLDDDPGEFPTSAYAVSGIRAFAIGNDAAYGIECEE